MFSLLYIDDEPGLLELGQLFLESTGEFKVTTALSAAEGLEQLARQDFDAIVSDFQMPVMDGIALLKEVRKSFGSIPFVLFTGRGREEVVIEAINNGVDFYLQKGGDPRSQFAELSHKVRQAVNRRRAEAALSDSEKRLADIINFLPDATFAIDKDRKVIAWNRAIEEMTGIPATDMLGKGDYEYALPFYNTRRPILIDLIFEPEEVIAANYSHIIRQKNLLTADTTLPRPKGREVTLMGVAGPLYDRRGQLIGAIESIRDITERKRAEDALNESERRFRELADLLPQGIYEADNRGRMTYANRLALEMSGYTAEDIERGLNALSVIAPVDRERATEVLLNMVKTGSRDRGNAEYLAVRKDASTFPVSIYSSPIYRDGKITGIRGVIMDITDRKKAEENLISANLEYTNLLDQIQDVYYRADADGLLVKVSRSWADLFGYDDISECIGRNIADDFYYHPSDRQHLLDEIARNGKVTGYEVTLKKKDGTPILVEVSSHPYYDPAGAFIGIEGTFRDITARKKAEEELRAAYEQLTANEEELKERYNELAESEKKIRESEERYRTVFETTGTAMLTIEEDATISLVNGEFCRMSGYQREEIENKKKWMEFVFTEDRDRMLAQHRQRRTDPDHTLKQYEFRFVTRSGEIRYIFISIDIIPGTTKSVASLLDITERRKAADEIQAVNEQLVASDEELRAQYDELAYSEKLIRMSEARLQFMLGFYEYARKSERELLGYAIEGAGIVTGSALGYLAFLNDDETELSMYAWSKNTMTECSMVTKPIVYQVEKTGLWGEAVRQRRPVITNDYAAPNPAKKGYPEGHPHIFRHMNVPVIDNGHIVLVAGVANKSGDYTEHDVNELLLLMQGLWEILKRRRVQEAKTAADEMLRKSEEELRLLKISTDRSSDQIFWLDFAGNILYVNDAACRDYGYSREEFSHMKIFELNPDVNAEIWRLSVEDLRERKNQFITTRHQRRDGSIMDVEIVTVYVSQDDREYSFAYVRDITSRRKTEIDLKAAYEQVTAAEEELREQYDTLAAAEAEISSRRRQLEEIASTVPGVVYQFYARQDGSRGMYYAGNRAREIFGLEPDLEKFFPEFTARVHPDDRDSFLASIDDAVHQRSDWHFEGRFIRGSGETIWFEGRSTPVNHGGELVFSGVLLDITSRKNMEAAILESEEKYRSLVDLSPVAVIVHRDGKVLYANPEALRLAGAGRAEQVVGRDIVPFIHPDDRAMAMEDFRLLSEEGKTIPLKEERLVRVDGTPFTVEITAMPIPYHGTPAFLAVFRDITERKQAEAALAESERKYRTVFETAEEGIWIIDAGFRTVSANRKMQEIFGYTGQEMTGRPVWDFVPPDEAESMKQELSKRPRGIPGRYERRWVRKDGAVIWCLTSATPLFSPSGEFLGSFGMFTDITERRQTEDALRASEKKYRLLVENIPFGITLIDADHRIIMSNTAQGQMFHTDAGLWPGQYCYQEFEKRDAVCTHCPGTRAMATGVCEEVETEGVRDDGTRFNARIHAIPLPDDEGNATRFIEIVEDITERKKVEDALRQNEKKYRALVETTGTGFVILDHEGRVLDANPEYIRMTGHTRLEDISGRSVTEWTAALEQERNADAVRQCIRDGFIRNFEIDYTDNAGAITPVEINATVVQSEGAVHILTLCRDITERKRVENELLRLKISTDRSSDEIFWMDFAGNILYVNDAACRITGYSRDEFLKMKIFELDPDVSPEIWDASVADLRERKTQFITTRHRCRDGTIIDVEIVAVYVNQYDREYSFAYVRDITGRKRTEDALFRSQQMLQAVLDSVPQRVFWKDRDSVFLGCNKLLALDAGYADPADLVGKTDYDHASRATADLYRADDRQVMESGQPRINYEEPQIRPDGSQAWLRTTKVPLRNKEGAIIGVLGTYEDITEQKQAREALKESEEKYRTLVESSFDGIAIHQDGILVYVNRTAARILGSDDPGVFNGKPAIEVVAPAFRERISDRVQRGPESSQELIHEQFLKTDGTAVDVDVTSTPCTWNGKPAVYVTFRDITAQVRAEEAFHESSRKYAELFELGSEALFVIDNETGALLETNSAACEMYGYPRDVLLTMKNTDLSAEQEETRKVTTETPQGIVRVPLRYHRRRDGTVFPVEIIGRFFVWNGRPVHIAAIRDITEHKRAEAALVESEEKYRTLVEINRDIIYSLSTDGTILYVSPQALAQIGYRSDEMEGRNFIDFIHPDDTALLLNHIRENSSTRDQVRSDQFRVRRKDGMYRWFEDNTIYTTDRQQRPVVVGTIRDITEEKAAQDALRESEEKFRVLVESTSDFIWEVDTEGKYTYVSPQVRRILGYEPEELLGRTPFEIMPRTDAESIAAEFKRCVASRLPITALENKAIRKDGSIVILETSGVVRTADDGSYQGYRGIDRDITKRKQAEEALRESEARLSSILHGSPVLQFVIDRNHRVISWNKALEEYSGIRAADMAGTDHQWRAFYAEKRPVLADLLLDGNTEAISRLYTGKLNKSRYVEGAYEATDFFPRMGGAGTWLSFTAAPIRDEQGVVIGAIETLEDVTERVNAEKALRESEERSRTILNTAQAGIVLVDADTHEIVDANKKALEMIGLDRESVIGGVCHHFICPAEEGKCPVTDLGQQVDTSERVLITATGQKIPVLKTVVPVSISGRSVLVESFVDIVEQKRSEAAIREANRKLNLLNSITRHDIRNQLMVAAGYTQLAGLTKPDAAVMDFLAKITAAIETIQRQIEFTKAYQELGVHAPSWFRVGEIIDSVRPVNIALRNTCTSVEIYADPMIDKVFFNLFDNAVKYGERVTTVTVGCEEIDDYLVITFADDGCGISPGEKKKIFGKGYGKNTGLGLFLVREILAITGITIHENGTFGEGAVFEIIVPKGAYRGPE